ncbi:MAG: FISUMP domain-containing protein [Massilibacteroides sp.]|nr:FISUMP domain-containing protein [Massilibacteroides sp.]
MKKQRRYEQEFGKGYLCRRDSADSVTHWQCKSDANSHTLRCVLIRAFVSYVFQLRGLLSLFAFRAAKQLSGYFFPAAGYRNIDGSINSRGTNGNYWSSSSHSSTSQNAWNLNFNSGNANLNNNNRANGFSVRCVSENLPRLCFFILIKSKG